MNTQKDGGGGVSVARWGFDMIMSVVYFFVSRTVGSVFHYIFGMFKLVFQLSVFGISFALTMGFIFAPASTTTGLSAIVGVIRYTITREELYVALLSLLREAALQPLMKLVAMLLSAPEQ